jgi:hypothetical protein
MSTTDPIATEQGHYYDARDGSPRYTVPKKDGKGERATTIRDAKLHGWVPSVTTITKVMAAPGLENWKQDQILHAALTLPRIAGETEQDFAKRVKADAKAQGIAAAARGTALHGSIEQHIHGKTVPPEHFAHVNKVEIELEKVGIDLKCGKAEHSFAHPAGYGGKVDAHGDGWVVDFKTKDKIDPDKTLAWDEHVIQLAMYAHGLGIVAPRCLNVFVGIDDCAVVIVEHNCVAIERGLRMGLLCLSLWQEQKDYRPSETVSEHLDRMGL